LVAERETFRTGTPDMVGGGTVDIVNLEDAYWADLPDKEEAGTPDIVGAVALAAAIEFFDQVGWQKIIDHEAELTRYALEQLGKSPSLKLYGDIDPQCAGERLGVVSFNIDTMPHGLVAAILSYEWAIGTRNGCFCAHPYVKAIMHVDEILAKRMEEEILHRDRSHLPGTVRASFGIYNTKEEIDKLCAALRAIASGRRLDGYQLNKERGEYFRRDSEEQFEEYFKL
jgi:cysteine desulfurase / selenocysteine lyase